MSQSYLYLVVLGRPLNNLTNRLVHENRGETGFARIAEIKVSLQDLVKNKIKTMYIRKHVKIVSWEMLFSECERNL